MDLMLDVAALCGLEWLYEKVEARWGTVAAWFTTVTLAAMILGAMIALTVAII